MLTRAEIKEVVARFETQRESFELVRSEVHRRIGDLLQRQALKNVVTSRAKWPSSLERSLFRDREKWRSGSFDDRLAPPLMDLAGVRVLLYREADLVPAQRAILELFSDCATKWTPKDKTSPGAYSALHLFVCLEPVCVPAESGWMVRDLPCEVQICTITQHLWNELEHDIVYKQPDGTPDDGQKELLASLRAELSLSAKTVERLMDRTAARKKMNDFEIVGPDELRHCLEGRFRRRLDGGFEDLLHLLEGLLDRVTPAVIDGLIKEGTSEDDAVDLRNKYDPDGAHRDVGLVALGILPALPEDDVLDVLEANASRPLFRLLQRVVEGKRET